MGQTVGSSFTQSPHIFSLAWNTCLPCNQESTRAVRQPVSSFSPICANRLEIFQQVSGFPQEEPVPFSTLSDSPGTWLDWFLYRDNFFMSFHFGSHAISHMYGALHTQAMSSSQGMLGMQRVVQPTWDCMWFTRKFNLALPRPPLPWCLANLSRTC